MPDAVSAYLSLLKRSLTRELFLDEQVVDVLSWPQGGALGDPDETWAQLHASGLRLVRPFRAEHRQGEGVEWPLHAETMVGRRRLDNVEELVTRVVEEGIPGDLVETGVWRGGVITLMRAVLLALGDQDRTIWACDSFEGLPEPNVEEYPADAGYVLDGFLKNQIGVSRSQVEHNIARYDLLDDRIRFLEGWFKDTLPDAPIEQIALLRLDGDLYESTMDALQALEPKVSPGGFVIVDDYLSWEPCKLAVTDYRERHGIVDEIHEIDWTGVWWQKTAR